MMESKSWSYMGTAGAWIARVEGGSSADARDRLHRVIEIVCRGADGLSPYHRPRHVAMEWSEFGEHGDQGSFHDDEADASSWDAALETLRALDGGQVLGVIETLFIDLDTEVELDEGIIWLEHAAELQLSVGEGAEPSHMSIAVTYRTTVDLWLPENTTTRALGTDNSALAARNHPRLRQTLERLEACLGVPLLVSDSDRYLDYMTSHGFRVPSAGNDVHFES
jgi:hypothetical protein